MDEFPHFSQGHCPSGGDWSTDFSWKDSYNRQAEGVGDRGGQFLANEVFCDSSVSTGGLSKV